MPLLLDKLNIRFLHNKSHTGLSRRTIGRKYKQAAGIFSKMNNPPKTTKFPIASKPMQISIEFPNIKVNPQGLCSFDQIRALSSSDQCVTDEAEFDSILHQREFEMHRHKRGPLSKIVKYAKDAVKVVRAKTECDLKILDIASSPIDTPVTIAKELPGASLYAISSSRDMLKIMSDKVVEGNAANVMIEFSDLIDLSEFDNSSFDLVISCYGLQNSRNHAKLIEEIHRVLKPGGRMISAIWEHLGTEPIVDRIVDKVLPVKKMLMEKRHLTKPHEFEKMVEDSGLKVLDINHGEYPFYLSSIDGLHSSAFDLVSLPIKKELVELMHSGERPYAFEDARAEFDDIVMQGHLITTDSQGRLVVEDNRYKIIVARRQYEDNDRQRDIEKAKESIAKTPKFDLALPDTESVKEMMKDFNSLLIDTLPLVPNSPWKRLVESVKQDIAASGHNLSKKFNVLDLASSPNEATKMMAECLPDVNIHCTDISPEGVTDMKKFTVERQLDHITSSKISERQLKDFEDSSMDIVTCSFGLTRFSDPDSILQEVHRVLKPGGSFITTTWDSIALERIGDEILSHVLADKEPHIVTPISNLSSYSTPRKLERLIESTGNLGIMKVDHFEFPFYLGDAGTDTMSLSTDERSAFNNAILPIRHLLKTLEETGVNPNAFDDARRVYHKLLNENQLMWKDEYGKVRTVRNRYKFLVARRKFEDANGIVDKTEMNTYNKNH